MSRIASLTILISLTACRTSYFPEYEEPEKGAETQPGLDMDFDGYTASEDCDDNNAAINPGATEVCDGIDNNCDGAVDADDTAIADATRYYLDIDEDGYGDSASWIKACEQPTGYVEQGSDCDDSNSDAYPSAPEDCSAPEDLNCDGFTGYSDADGDGWPACEDCNDADASVHPDAEEICDGADNNCDGYADDDATDAPTWYADQDADGWGGDSLSTTACEQPTGYAEQGGDCDDADASRYPTAPEYCDGVDSSCQTLSFLEEDADGDGTLACDQALWLSEAPASSPGNEAIEGSSEAASLLADEGVSWSEASVVDQSWAVSDLKTFGIIVMHSADMPPLDYVEAEALEQWLSDGGRLLYIGTEPGIPAADRIASLPASIKLESDPDASGYSGEVQVDDGPITKDVEAVAFGGSEYWLSSGQPAARYQDNTLVINRQIGKGYFVGIADERPLQNAGTGDGDISAVDNQQLIINTWAWLHDSKL